MSRILLIIPFVVSITQCLGQCVDPIFNIKNTALCQQENLMLENLTPGTFNYNWDFCSFDFATTPSIGNTNINTALNSPNDVTTFVDEDNIYQLICSRSNNKIFLYNYGTDLDNSDPAITEFTNPFLNGPEWIKIIKNNSDWVAYILNFNDSHVIRMTFENANFQSPIFEDLDNPNNLLTRARGLSLVNDNAGNYLFITNFSDSQIHQIPLVSDWSSELDLSNLTSYTNSGFLGLMGIDFINICGDWYGILSSYVNGKYFLVDFSDGLDSAPIFTDLSISLTRPIDISWAVEAGNYYAFGTGEFGNFYMLDFETSVSTLDNFTDFGNFDNSIQNAYGFDMIKYQSTWRGFSMNYGTKKLSTIVFDNDCGVNIDVDNSFQPSQVKYSEPGTHWITLTSTSESGISTYQTLSVDISANSAPQITFNSSSNECLGHPNIFTPVDEGGLTYEWSFDNGETIGSTATSPSHTFSQVGDSIVTLTVNDGTCSNFVKDTISIFPVPQTPTFSTPGAPYCTGDNLVFESLFDESNFNGATLTYEWDYNGEGNSTARDGAFNFDSDGTKTITLTASIPGCSTPSAGTDIELIAGPNVNFSSEDKCLGDQTQFVNSSTGTGITSQTWNFGDGSSNSTLQSPTHQFPNYGAFNVSLTVNNSSGCSNELTLPITIDDKPVASFNNGPPCEGVAIPFEDGSTVNGLSNIILWSWDFDSEGTSTMTDPSFTFDQKGNYNVELIVETSDGCKDTVVNLVNVQLAPVAKFQINQGCINSETTFLNQSEDDFSNPITQWVWTVDGKLASYNSSFGEVYNETGNHTVSLSVKAANNCQSLINDNFTITELPKPDFSIAQNCDNELTEFSDVTNAPIIPIAKYTWNFDDLGTTSSNPGLFNFDQAGEYLIGLTVEDEIGCKGTIQKSITIHSSPTAIIGADKDIGSNPLVVNFTDESIGNTSVFWSFNDPDNQTSSNQNPSFTYEELGDFETQLIASNDQGCQDTATMTITVANPILDIELVQIITEESEDNTNVSLSVKNNGNVTLNGFKIRIDLDNDASIFESYTGTITRGETISYPLNFTFSTLSNNIKLACITVLDNEQSFEDINIVNNEACINFNGEFIAENPYPNPLNSDESRIRINLILPSTAPVQIFLLDASGAILYQNIYMETSIGLNSFFLDINSFQQGMYFIKVVYNQQESTQRFVKL